MADKKELLTQTLTPELLAQVRNFWFEHIPSEEGRTLLRMEDGMRWFKKDEKFDQDCVEQFKPALETILSSGANSSDILAAVNPTLCLDWVSLILLLDQLPRNCYRGDSSKLVFTRFDPLAVDVALKAFEEGVPTQTTDVRWRLAYRTWFHLPLMHSEDLSVHERAVKIHEETRKDFEGFLAKDVSSLAEGEKGCYAILKGREEELKKQLGMSMDFEVRHKVIIEKFGRYPHRNQAMGRESTAEEIDYLENGGETFG